MGEQLCCAPQEGELMSVQPFLLILPPLPTGLCLNELIINPHQQHMDAFFWVMDWEGMISVSSLVGLLEKHFFPKWLQVGGPRGPAGIKSHRAPSSWSPKAAGPLGPSTLLQKVALVQEHVLGL